MEEVEPLGWEHGASYAWKFQDPPLKGEKQSPEVKGESTWPVFF